LGDRDAFWARELTKSYEDLQSGTISDLLELASEKKNRGEFVLIVHPGERIVADGENVQELLVWYRENTTLSLKDVSKKLATDLGLSRSAVYQDALVIYKKKSELL
jgi:16S rRNA (cytidine1402-2'-O)-methyltransferase